MLQWIVKKVVGTRNQREIRRLSPLIAQINEQEASLRHLSDEQLQSKTMEFKTRIAEGATLDDLLPEAFAVVKNCCRRFTEARRTIEVRGQSVVWEMIPFDVQLIGGMVLHQGKISEMATGEGKTLVATLPVYLNALTGKGVHVVTVNDYLASRDAEWMGEIYKFLGLTVGCIQHGQSPEERRSQYHCDITYGTCSEFGFDYLRDNGMATSVDEQVQRGHVYAIIDEVDSILIDEARTPLIISGPVTVSTHQYDKFKNVISSLVKKQGVLLTELVNQAKDLVEKEQLEEAGKILFKVKLGMPRNKLLLKLQENPDVRRAMDDAELALYSDSRRTELYKLKEELYFSIDEKNSESDLSEMGRKFLSPGDPNAFVMPDLITIHHDIDQDASKTPDEREQAKQKIQREYDEASQRIHNISQLLKAYCVFEKDVHYVVQENKVIIVDEYTGRLMPGRRWSDGLHQAVEAKEGAQIDRETQTLATITIQNYFRLYQKLAGMTGTAETEANEFKDIYKLDVLVIPTNQPCVRKDSDDLIFKTRRAKLNAIIQEIKQRHQQGQPILVGTTSVESSELLSRMLKRENIPHSVLNAKFHQQEAEIVARAGQYGAVTIATNMAGRGTDIKLAPGVPEVGGLHVVGTERHEARRIDRQLRGRCARQGDPGSSQFYISFEDDLMRNFGDPRRIAKAVTFLGMKDEEGIQHRMLNHSVETAQKRVEERNYQIRKHTLQYDDVMNQQRTVIYTYRNDILTTENPRVAIFEVVDEVIETQCETCFAEEAPNIEELIKWMNTTFPLGLSRKEIDETKSPEEIAQQLKARVHAAYELKIKFEQSQALTSLERYIVLNAIDTLWQEHLYAMDGLRTSINLRAYGQKDPLIEYKQEAYTMFEQLMASIKQQIVHNLFRASSSLTAFDHFLRAIPQRYLHGEASAQAAGVPSASSSAPNEESDTDIRLPVRHTGKKMGRNDPCPLDPNKKFKNCCGANGSKYCHRASS
ncbi:MAG: preprotein translocase subunit SecA [Verrucomicrobiota bacterium]